MREAGKLQMENDGRLTYEILIDIQDQVINICLQLGHLYVHVTRNKYFLGGILIRQICLSA